MKKYLIIFITIISLMNIIPVAESSFSGVTNNTITDHYEKNQVLLEELYPAMDQPITIQNPSSISDITLTETPSEFSWRNYQGKDLTTPAKNQGWCGSCWAFAAMGAIESIINIHEGFKDIDIDLSEQYMLSCVPAAGSCNGGTTASPFNFIINTSEEGNFLNGVIFEECLPYEAEDMIPCSQKTENWLETLVSLSGFGEIWFGPDNQEAADIIKSIIYENGPVYALMFVDDSFRNFGSIFHRTTDYFRYRSNTVDYLNHAILIVGWKDDPLIDKGGYWICKNSWDTDWGYDGFFNIEYDTSNMQYYIAWPEYDPESFDFPPLSDAGGFYHANENEQIVFDGSNSFDVEDDNLSYLWDFGDGITAEGVITQFSFQSSGVYSIQLTVKDSNNKSSTDSSLVFINNDPISFEFSGNFGITLGLKNELDMDISDTLLSIDILGSYQNMDHRTQEILSIPAYETYQLTLPIVGFGKGIMHIDYEGIEVIKNFFSIGPFVLI